MYEKRKEEHGGGKEGGYGGRGAGKGKGKFGMRRREKREDIFTGRIRKKTCRFCEEKVDVIDFKDMRRYERLVSERGKMLSRRLTGVCAKHQRKVEEAVKKARFMALLPFVKR
jgi:small subunit ribosomal protein S18